MCVYVHDCALCVLVVGGIDPSEWIGAGQFKNEELDLIRGMMQKKRFRSTVERTSTIPKPRFVIHAIC